MQDFCFLLSPICCCSLPSVNYRRKTMPCSTGTFIQTDDVHVCRIVLLAYVMSLLKIKQLHVHGQALSDKSWLFHMQFPFASAGTTPAINPFLHAMVTHKPPRCNKASNQPFQ